MNRRMAATAWAAAFGAMLAASVHAQSSSGMMSSDGGGMGMMDGPMMEVMTDPGPGMDMMYGPTMVTCPMMGTRFVTAAGPMMGGPMMGGPMMGAPMSGSAMLGGPMMGSPMMGAGIGRLLYVPNLSAEQRQKLVDRGRALQRQLLQLQEKALEAQFALQDVTGNDAPDPKVVGRALQNVYAVRTQMVEAAIAAANDARSLLTDEQREALSKPPMGMSPGGMPGPMMRR